MVAPLRRYLVAGLLIWVPLGVTLLIIKFLVDLMDQTLLLLPQGWQPEPLFRFRCPWVALLCSPHAHSWSLAFQAGEGSPEIRNKTGRDILSVFVPTTPNPTSGFFLMVPREENIELDLSVDE